jgi:hypothetical protein
VADPDGIEDPLGWARVGVMSERGRRLWCGLFIVGYVAMSFYDLTFTKVGYTAERKVFWILIVDI